MWFGSEGFSPCATRPDPTQQETDYCQPTNGDRDAHEQATGAATPHEVSASLIIRGFIVFLVSLVKGDNHAIHADRGYYDSEAETQQSKQHLRVETFIESNTSVDSQENATAYEKADSNEP